MSESTSSSPSTPAISGLAGNRWVMSADDLAALPESPKHLVVLGSGQGEIELAKKYASQGVLVTLLEPARNLATTANANDSMTLASELTKAGVKVNNGVDIRAVSDLGEAAAIDYHEGLNSAARIFADAIVASDDIKDAATSASSPN